MNRRPFIKLLGSNLLGLPLALGSTHIFETKSNWESLVAQLQHDGQIEKINELWVVSELPTQPVWVSSGEFAKANDQVFFYGKRQYCFRVFEKTHPQVGAIDLLIPFWKQEKGAWVQIACLSAYGLEALVKASRNPNTVAQVLPLKAGQVGSFVCALGTFNVQTTIRTDATAHTHAQIRRNTQIIWQEHINTRQTLATHSF